MKLDCTGRAALAETPTHSPAARVTGAGPLFWAVTVTGPATERMVVVMPALGHTATRELVPDAWADASPVEWVYCAPGSALRNPRPTAWRFNAKVTSLSEQLGVAAVATRDGLDAVFGMLRMLPGAQRVDRRPSMSA